MGTLQRETWRPAEEVEKALIGALCRLQRERLLIFVEPRRAGDSASHDTASHARTA